MELNDLRIIICLRKSEVSVERISVCNFSFKNWQSMAYKLCDILCLQSIIIIILSP